MEHNYASAFAENNPSGFSNNWLESRNNIHLFDQNYSDYKLYEDNGQQNTIYRDLLKTRVERNPVSDAYFGDANINHLKKLICDQVYQQSGGQYKISPQSQNTEPLVMVMMTYYLDHARNLPNDIKKQVAELNYMVILDMVPRTLSNIKQQLSYIRDRSQQPLAMDRPMWISSAGTKSNPSVTKTFI